MFEFVLEAFPAERDTKVQLARGPGFPRGPLKVDAHEFMQAPGKVGGRLDPISSAHPGFCLSRHSCPQDNTAREDPPGLSSVLTAAPQLSLPLLKTNEHIRSWI